MEPELRVYSPQTDFDEVFALAREIISEPPYEAARRELLAYPGRELTAKVAVAKGKAISGFCAATHPYWNSVSMIDYLVVSPDSRGRGLGSRLVSAVEAELRESGIRIVSVQTASWNEAGIRFYEDLGYAVRARFTEYLGRGNDLVWLDRILV